MQDNTQCVNFWCLCSCAKLMFKKGKKSKPLWPHEVLTSQNKFAGLIYICQQEGDFEKRHSKPANLRKRYHFPWLCLVCLGHIFPKVSG